MKILIDTHIFLWTILEPFKLSATMKQVLTDPATELVMSTASVWEIGTKYALGKLPLNAPPDLLVPQQMAIQAIEPLPLTLAHALLAHQLPPHHRDPFDRILIAQAQVENLPLMTSDPQFRRYSVKLLR